MTENLDQVVSNLRAGCDYRLENGRFVRQFVFVDLMESQYNISGLIEAARKYQMTDSEREKQRISFAYGNVKMHNDELTREDVEKAAKDFKRQAQDQANGWFQFQPLREVKIPDEA